MSEYKEILIMWNSEKYLLPHDLDKINGIENSGFLYQIYGNSHIYGRDVLLYIGKTDREMGRRINEHLNSVFQWVNNLSIVIGRTNKNIDLEIPESILIVNHKPSYNKEFIHDLPEKAKDKKIILINNGNPHMLKTVCTNYWWVK